MSIPESNGKTVLITGINGYIASVLGLRVLSKGYSLVGTTRRLESTKALLEGPYSAFASRVKILEVPNMTVDGAFDEAVRDVHGIFHTASPINFQLDTYEDTVGPAVKGSEVLLNSALRAGPQLEAVIVTSSVAALLNPKTDPEYTFTEADFASNSLNTAEKDRIQGKSTPSGILYSASKTAAEIAVWKFRDEIKPKFAICTVNPGVVIGPPVVLPSSPSALNQTLKPLFYLTSGIAKEVPPMIGSGTFVDVRDVALIHLWAFENSSKTNGERYVATAGYGPTQAIADILRQAGWDHVAEGTPGEGYIGYNSDTKKTEGVAFPPGKIRVDGSKAERAIGFKYRTLKESVMDTAEALKPLY